MSNWPFVTRMCKQTALVEHHYHMSIRRFDLLSALKLVCTVLIFAPQWGLLWQSPNTNSGSWGGSAPTLWVIAQIQSFLAESKFLPAIIYVAVCGLSLAGLAIIPFIYSNIVRVPLLLVFMICCGFELFILDINGSFTRQSMLYTLWGERAQTDTATYYTREIIRNGLFILAVSAFLLARPTVYFSLSKRWALVGYKQSHCTINGPVVPGEGYVPLFAMTHIDPNAFGASLSSYRWTVLTRPALCANLGRIHFGRDQKHACPGAFGRPTAGTYRQSL